MSLTAEQVETRKRGIGGSEMFAALGKDSRCSRLELYMRKVGELPELDFSDDPRVHFGVVLEPVILNEMGRRLGHEIISPRQTLVHPNLPIVGSPDGWIPALGEGAECKAVDKHEAEEFGEPDTDQIPVRFVVQCTTYIAVTDAPRWHLGVLIGGNDFRMYVIERDEQLVAAIKAGAREFWSHVEQRRPPTPETPDDVKLRWPKHIGRAVVATPEIEELCAELAGAKTALKEAELKEASLKFEIQKFMEDASDLVDSRGEKLATWRTSKASKKWDVKQAVADMPDVMKQYEYEQPGARPFLLK